MINVYEILKLNKEGKTICEISKILKYSKTTIGKYLKLNNLSNNTTSLELYKNLLKELVNSGKTFSELCEILKISHTTIKKYLNILGLTPKKQKASNRSKENIKLTTFQKQVLYGSLLGDMGICKHYNFARFTISQGGNQEEYFDYKCNIFKNIIGKVNKAKRFDKRTNKFYNKFTVHSVSNKLFLDIYNEFYINNRKSITTKILNKLTPISLAYWYMDDGDKTGVLATNCFSREECELMRDTLLNKFKITTTLQKQGKNQYVIYIDKNGKKAFYNLCNKYFIPSMLYKIQNWIP